MQYATLGSSGLIVSRLAMTFGEGRLMREVVNDTGQEAASRMVHEALEAGYRTGDGLGDAGLSYRHLVAACEHRTGRRRRRWPSPGCDDATAPAPPYPFWPEISAHDARIMDALGRTRA